SGSLSTADSAISAGGPAARPEALARSRLGLDPDDVQRPLDGEPVADLSKESRNTEPCDGRDGKERKSARGAELFERAPSVLGTRKLRLVGGDDLRPQR